MAGTCVLSNFFAVSAEGTPEFSMNYVSGIVDASNLQLYLGDFNNDNAVNVADVNAINQYILSGGKATVADIMKIKEINQQAEKYMLENNYNFAEIQKTIEINAEVQNLMDGDLYE